MTKEIEVGRWGVIELEVKIVMFGTSFYIHRASLSRRNNLVSVGVKEASVQGQSPGTPNVAGEEIQLGRLPVAGTSLHG